MAREIESQTVERVRSLKPTMVSAIVNAPDGISIADLYEKMCEAGETENIIRSTFLNLASTEGLYLDKNHKVRISSQE